ncbi:DUF6614 family protein [Defluviimonas sp. D31]|uniref:5-carboxymethyl-2-hydroxymuconate isomerase n=1 Tax=Albidovulum salinarum TaxID=2984153 RepID=A0ABT2X0U4_9RHOB|nr:MULTISPECIES: DUF6614 family protein [unclassified Defluviimonas]MCU9847556.1 hypothetical protein [Defluviimonas sp. WL0024]MDW4550027.1 DUF6614 family protein [Defluviimonas sp. D31]
MAYHMHTIFNLKPGIAEPDFAAALADFAAHLRDENLLLRVGPLGRRHRNPTLDTDTDRGHQFFVTMTFTGRRQADDAVDRIRARTEPLLGLHRAVYGKVHDQLFTCFEDI